MYLCLCLLITAIYEKDIGNTLVFIYLYISNSSFSFYPHGMNWISPTVWIFNSILAREKKKITANILIHVSEIITIYVFEKSQSWTEFLRKNHEQAWFVTNRIYLADPFLRCVKHCARGTGQNCFQNAAQYINGIKILPKKRFHIQLTISNYINMIE